MQRGCVFKRALLGITMNGKRAVFSLLVLLIALPIPSASGGRVISISHNGSSWGVLEEENGMYSFLTVSGKEIVSSTRLNLTGEPCGLVWNGSEWVVETFVHDNVIFRTLNGSFLFKIRSYDYRGFCISERELLHPNLGIGDDGRLLPSPGFSERKPRENNPLRVHQRGESKSQ